MPASPMGHEGLQQAPTIAHFSKLMTRRMPTNDARRTTFRAVPTVTQNRETAPRPRRPATITRAWPQYSSAFLLISSDDQRNTTFDLRLRNTQQHSQTVPRTSFQHSSLAPGGQLRCPHPAKLMAYPCHLLSTLQSSTFARTWLQPAHSRGKLMQQHQAAR